MDLVEGIKTRRSARKYRADTVSRELLQEVINLAKWAPSDMNTQPWQVTVMRDKARDGLVKILKKGIDPLKPLLKERFPPKIGRATELFFQNMGDAPVIMVVTGDKRDSDVEQRVVIESCSAFTQNLLLICHSHGLATCWVGSSLHFERECLEYIDKTDRILIATITVGLPVDTYPAPPRREVSIDWIA